MVQIKTISKRFHNYFQNKLTIVYVISVQSGYDSKRGQSSDGF